MTARQVIHELEALPLEEQAKVVRFVYRLDAERQLTNPVLSHKRKARQPFLDLAGSVEASPNLSRQRGFSA